MPAYTNEEYIQKAKIQHDNKYTYEHCDYKGSREKVTVTCPDHGDFELAGSKHLSGGGCAICDREKRAAAATKSTPQFVSEARVVHGEKYKYDKTIYVHSVKALTITCQEHGDFQQKPCVHLSGSGCSQCGQQVEKKKNLAPRTKLTAAVFIARAQIIFGQKYDYSKVIYINFHTKVTLICDIHGDFEISPHNHLQEQGGCRLCGLVISGLKRRKTLEEFLEKCLQTHGRLYNYSKVIYSDLDSKISIICSIHGEFQQRAYNHAWVGQGCPTCAGNAAFTTLSFAEKASKVHKNRYTYLSSLYTLSHLPIVVTCQLHGDFKTQPYRHLQGQGCPQCSRSATSSKVQIQWLEWMAVKRGIYIMHAANQGEHKIKNSRYLADGYDQTSNTIFEFWGDFWHGNPRMYDPADYNDRTKITFGEAYDKTLTKIDHIKSQGYNFVEIWEDEWNRMIDKIIWMQRRWRYRKFRA